MSNAWAHSASWERVTEALERKVGHGRTAGTWTRYCCPHHEGDGRHHNPSLGVKYLDDQARTKVRCFGGCTDEQVLDAISLEIKDLYDKPLEKGQRSSGQTRGGWTRSRRPQPQTRRESPADRAISAAGFPAVKPKRELGEQRTPWKTTDTYTYVRDDGTVAGEVIRREAQFERGRGKRFSQRAWNSAQGDWQDTGFDPVPFQLPQVLAAIADGEAIYICEGEKDVHTAERAGLTATTNAGGALSWTPDHAKWLRGASLVVVVADQDPAGYRRAEKVLASLDGLVDRVRVVAPATGNDFTDHIDAGHEVSEMTPIPHLDPFTRPTASPRRTTPTNREAPAADTEPVTAALTPEGGPTDMAQYMMAPDLDAAPDHTPDIDSAGAEMSRFWQLMLAKMLAYAQKLAEQRRREREEAAAKADDERRETEQRHAAERQAVETRLAKLKEKGWDSLSVSEIEAAFGDAVAWAEDSKLAAEARSELVGYVAHRYGVHLDMETGGVLASPAPNVADALLAKEGERATQSRTRRAQDRMVEEIARQDDLDQSVKEQLYADIEAWRANPTPRGLDELTKKMRLQQVSEPVRTKVRFIASYLGTPGQIVADDELGSTRTPFPTAELRKMERPLVDLGEEAKPRVDKLLEAYQDRLKTGMSTTSVQERLRDAVAVMTPEDQQAARDRGSEIRTNPAGKFARLWPDHVDREELAATVRMYASVATQASRIAGRAGDLGDPTAAALRQRAEKDRASIRKALTQGKGLHPLEQEQLRAVLVDVDAGKHTTPELLFVDDRSASVVDMDRASAIAYDHARYTRHKLGQMLESNQAPRGTARRTREQVQRVADAQIQLAVGNATLTDHEDKGVDRALIERLAAAGVPEGMRNRIRAELDATAGQASVAGKQAKVVQERWADRRDAVTAVRTPPAPGYDSRDRLDQMAEHLRAQGMPPDEVTQRIAAESTCAHPTQEAVKAALKGRSKSRNTRPGAGMHITNHRGRGKGDRGFGR
ncbi:toprim domain-containing protein [Nocardia grenadensis]|uniref:toprim domain-containing protein n=1 Tax=Nocardia grenadensis TaxID=931537 RepID=UPI000A03B05C|nr:hypothetical protein [Nocardia grenadensis]